MALFWRILGAVILVNLTVVGLFTALATMQFAGVNTSLAGERLQVLAIRAAAPFEQAVRLGLSLDTVRNASVLIERAKQWDESINAIHVFRSDGTVVFSSVGAPPERIPERVEAMRRQTGGRSKFIEMEDRLLSGVEILGSDGRSSGYLLIEYPASSATTRALAMIAELGMSSMAALLLASLIGAAMLRLGLAREIGHFRTLDGVIDAFERSAWRTAAGANSVNDLHDATDLRAQLERAEECYRSAGQFLGQHRGEAP